MKRLVITVAVALLAVCSSFAARVDLTQSIVWIREGFDPDALTRIPDEGEAGWVSFNPTMGQRTLLVRELKLIGLSSIEILAPVKRKPVTVTYIIPFEAGLDLLYTSDPAIFFGHIGINWQVYLNGSLLHSEVYLTEDGLIARERSLRDAIVPVDKRYLKLGRNILALRVVGDPTDDHTGLGVKGPYVIDRYATLATRTNDYVDLMLIGIYFFFALYHAILYWLRPVIKSYLFYGIGIFMLSVYLFSRGHIIVTLIPDTGIVKIIEYVALFMVLPSMFLFFDSNIRGRVSWLPRLYFWVGLALCVPLFFFKQELFLFAFMAMSAPVAIYVVAADFAAPMVRFGLEQYRATAGIALTRAVRAGARALITSRPGQFLLALLFLLAFVFGDFFIVNSGGVPVYSKFAYLILVLGTAAILASDFMSMYSQAAELNASLERKVQDRTRALMESTENRKRMNEEFSAGNRTLADSMISAERDMKIAVSVQRGFFPERPPQVDDWDVAFEYRPASGVSGDLYDFYVKGRRLEGLLVGDVSGHGIASGLITVLTRSLFYRGFMNGRTETLGGLLHTVNVELVKELSAVDNYLTAALLRFQGDRVEYVNAAHTDVIVRTREPDSARILEVKGAEDYKGPPLGREGLESMVKALKFSMNSGDAMIVYTDALIENKGKSGGRYTVFRLLDIFGKSRGTTAREILNDVYRDFLSFVGNVQITDDLTIVVVVKR